MISSTESKFWGGLAELAVIFFLQLLPFPYYLAKLTHLKCNKKIIPWCFLMINSTDSQFWCGLAGLAVIFFL